MTEIEQLTAEVAALAAAVRALVAKLGAPALPPPPTPASPPTMNLFWCVACKSYWAGSAHTCPRPSVGYPAATTFGTTFTTPGVSSA